MVRCVSCILLLHFVFSIFIVAERLASDYDAWDDSEEHKKLNKSTLGKGGTSGCDALRGSAANALTCLKEDLEYTPYKTDFHKSEDPQCHEVREKTIHFKDRGDWRGCLTASTEPVLVQVFEDRMRCWTRAERENSNQQVTKEEFMGCFQAERKPTPIKHRKRVQTRWHVIWGKNWP